MLIGDVVVVPSFTLRTMPDPPLEYTSYAVTEEKPVSGPLTN